MKYIQTFRQINLSSSFNPQKISLKTLPVWKKCFRANYVNKYKRNDEKGGNISGCWKRPFFVGYLGLFWTFVNKLISLSKSRVIYFWYLFLGLRTPFIIKPSKSKKEAFRSSTLCLNMLNKYNKILSMKFYKIPTL